MAKKKTKTDKHTEEQQTAKPDIKPSTDSVRKPADVAVDKPKCPPTVPPIQPAAPPAKKKRIRIRKKATKKLSAAIICQNPNITQFI